MTFRVSCYQSSEFFGLHTPRRSVRKRAECLALARSAKAKHEVSDPLRFRVAHHEEKSGLSITFRVSRYQSSETVRFHVTFWISRYQYVVGPTTARVPTALCPVGHLLWTSQHLALRKHKPNHVLAPWFVWVQYGTRPTTALDFKKLGRRGLSRSNMEMVGQLRRRSQQRFALRNP